MRGRRALPRSASRVVALAMALLMAASGSTLAASRPLDDERPPTFELLGGDAVAELAAELDYDLERIYRFVADEVRYEPYVGILRGARGTLASRAGNSWDQALLLTALLDESLIEYRFARGPLEQTAADQLLGAMSISAMDMRADADQLLVGDLDQALPAGIEAADSGARARAQAAAEAVDTTIADAAGLLQNDVATIETALAEAGVELPPAVPTLPPSEMTDHAWVQAGLGAEWLDLDPVLAGHEAGTALAEPQETLPSPPAELDHVIEFEVSLERVQGSSLVTEPIVQYSATAAELAGRAVTFGHIKPSGLEQLGITMRNLLGEGADEYRAALDIDGQSVVADVAIVFGRSDADGGGGLFGDADLFGEPAASPATGPADGEATAEWLEVRVTPPSGETVSARRTVFDRVAPGARFGGAPGTADVGPPVMVDLGGGEGQEVAAMVRMEGFVVATGPTSGAALIARATDPADGVLGTAALAYQYLRDVLAAEIGAQQGLRLYLDGPTVASVAMSVESAAAEPRLRVALDLWHRNIGTLPLADADAPVAHPALFAGVLAQVAERVALDQPGGDDGAPADHLSAGALFEAATAAGIPTVTYQGGLPDDTAYDPETVARMEEALAGGDIIVAPREPVEMAGTARMAWWRVDPVSGRTIDVLDDGAGSEQVEYTIPLTWEFRAASCLLALSGGILAGIVEALDLGGFDSAKHGVSIAAIIFQSFAAARGWTGSCR